MFEKRVPPLEPSLYERHTWALLYNSGAFGGKWRLADIKYTAPSVYSHNLATSDATAALPRCTASVAAVTVFAFVVRRFRERPPGRRPRGHRRVNAICMPQGGAINY